MKLQVTLPPVKKPKVDKKSLHNVENEIAKAFSNGLKIEAFIFPQLREHQVQGVNFMF
jgi:hypothetical protein